MNCKGVRPVHVSLGAYGRMPHGLAVSKAVHHTPSDPVREGAEVKALRGVDVQGATGA